MAPPGMVGSVAGLWRFPVKSMRGERLDEASLTAHGLVGDRAFALIDTDTGKVVSAKSVSCFPGCWIAGPPSSKRHGRRATSACSHHFSERPAVTSDAGDVDRVLRRFRARGQAGPGGAR